MKTGMTLKKWISMLLIVVFSMQSLAASVPATAFNQGKDGQLEQKVNKERAKPQKLVNKKPQRIPKGLQNKEEKLEQWMDKMED
jgi:Skp family chaperone for outer membrane proteins